ncbi:nucleotidyltransferase family protein [Candidatus Woesearchaeota archaeon]|nr:nucleotidyltransferase family protein [Candidatus Woesearchaeota archaeon]
MQCIIFCAGYATRLYPLTKDTPKPLLLVADLPMIEHILGRLDPHKQITKVHIVTNDKFYNTFVQWKNAFRSRFDITIHNDGTKNNEDRLGSIGDLDFVLKAADITEDVLLIAGDNLFDDGLGDLLGIFEVHKKPVIGVYDIGSEELATRFGCVEVDRRNIITKFEEKPAKANTTLIATFIYAMPAKMLRNVHDYLAAGNNPDLAGNYIKHLAENNEIFAVPLEGRWFDIGSLDQYQAANAHYRNR